VDNLEKIRLMMAEQRYIEAQQLLEQTLLLQKSQELLGLLIEVYQVQGVALPYDLALEFIKANKDSHQSLEIISQLNHQGIESKVLEIKLYASIGALNKLNEKISDFYLYLFERKIPQVFDEVITIRKKYFQSDFNLELKELALSFDRGWNKELEDEIQKIIKDCFHKFNLKNKADRLLKLEKIFASYQSNNAAKIYHHLFVLYNHGIENSLDYKKLIELIIYFEDVEMKGIVLNLMDLLSLEKEAHQYADAIKKDTHYNFVHFSKYYPHLKKYFITPRSLANEVKEDLEPIDLTLDEKEKEVTITDWVDDSVVDSDAEIAEGLKYMEYDPSGWLNLAVGFIQSDFNKSALMCAKKVKEASVDEVDFLKASYLAVHALMKLQDYRIALDYCYEALEKCTLETDYLSFSYLEVELLIQLGEKASAKKVLENIHLIDSSYRLSSKMLKRLNEI